MTAGDFLYALVWRDDGWCQGLSAEGRVGYLPQTYIAVVEHPETVPLPSPRIVEFVPDEEGLGFVCAGSHPVQVTAVRLVFLFFLRWFLAGTRKPVIPLPPYLSAHAQVVADSPAESAGVRAGDLILEVDSEPCADLDKAEILVRRRPGRR